MSVEILNLSGRKIDIACLRENILRALSFIKGGGFLNLSLVLVSAGKIRELNEKYRHKNSATDVLSFEKLDEIVICPEIVKKQAKKLKSRFNLELTRVAVHGILHLKGHDHEKNKKAAEKMQKIEDKIISKII